MDAAVPQIASTGRLPHLLLLLLVCLEGQGNRCGNAVSCCHKVKVNGGHKVNLIHIKHVSLGSKLTSAGWFSRLRFLTSNLYIPIYCPVYPHISPLTMFGVWSNGDHSFPQGQNSPSSSPPGPSWRSFPPQSAKHPGAGSAHRRSSDCSITWKSDMDDMVSQCFGSKQLPACAGWWVIASNLRRAPSRIWGSLKSLSAHISGCPSRNEDGKQQDVSEVEGELLVRKGKDLRGKPTRRRDDE